MIEFIGGLFLGFNLGFVTLALLLMSSKEDDKWNQSSQQ